MALPFGHHCTDRPYRSAARRYTEKDVARFLSYLEGDPCELLDRLKDSYGCYSSDPLCSLLPLVRKLQALLHPLKGKELVLKELIDLLREVRRIGR